MKKATIRGKGMVWILAAVLAMALAGGCGPLVGSGAKSTPSRLKLQGKIAVLPMDRASVRPGQEAPTCILTDKVADSGKIPPEVADLATSKLFGLLRGDPRFILIPKGQCMGFLQTLIATNVKESQMRMLQAFGRENHAAYVLYGQILRFRRRVGSNYSAKTPASVAFTLNLIRVRDGAVVWSHSFDRTQAPLTANLFQAGFYRKSGMRWVTAEELLSYGLDQAVKALRERLE